eukprot:GHVH01002565.1.p2 GENE.GHVH01002565.1~~GHVH01002565.1.p2  ORF type:complete len:218 (+),score=21.03 GHVH01002565.1:959-1612(+)
MRYLLSVGGVPAAVATTTELDDTWGSRGDSSGWSRTVQDNSSTYGNSMDNANSVREYIVEPRGQRPDDCPTAAPQAAARYAAPTQPARRQAADKAADKPQPDNRYAAPTQPARRQAADKPQPDNRPTRFPLAPVIPLRQKAGQPLHDDVAEPSDKSSTEGTHAEGVTNERLGNIERIGNKRTDNLADMEAYMKQRKKEIRLASFAKWHQGKQPYLGF